MFCKNCGKELKDGTQFCPACGTKTAAQPNVNTGGVNPDVATGGINSGAAAGTAVKAKAGFSKSTTTVLIAVAAVVVVVLSYLLFFRGGSPEDTVAQLEKAINKMDQEAILECFDSQTNEMYSNMLNASGELAGIDGEDFSELVDGLGDMMAENGLVPEFKLQVINVEQKGDKLCDVHVQTQMTAMGQTETGEGILPMVKEGRKWKITSEAAEEFFG